MRRIINLIFVFMLMLPLLSHADTQDGFICITCSEELGVFEIHESRIFGLPLGKEKRLSNFTAKSALKKEYGFVWYGEPVNYTCKLKDRIITVDLKRIDPKSHGQCGGEFKGRITIKQDGIIIVSGLFGSHCFNSIYSVTAHPAYIQTQNKEKKYLWKICRLEPKYPSAKYPFSNYEMICEDKWQSSIKVVE